MQTEVNMLNMKLTRRHIRIMLIAALGQFLGQGLATLVGIVIPLMNLSDGALPAAAQGLLGCISLIGIMIGTAVIGPLSDRYGYLQFFRMCPAAVLAASLTAAIFPSIWVLVPCLFVIGFAIGGEYSLDSDYISELMPLRYRTFMVGLAKALASAGSAVVAVICWIWLRYDGSAIKWQQLFLIVSGIAAVMVASRIDFAQSPAWLLTRGERAEAAKALYRLLGAKAALPTSMPQPAPKMHVSMISFIRTHTRKVVLTGVPWACEGLGVYGIGIFMPVLITAFGLDFQDKEASAIAHIESSVGLTFALCLVMMAGFAIGLVMLRRYKALAMQNAGFWGSAAGLALLAAAYVMHWPAWIAIAGFAFFELALNAGPHLITFILPSTVYSVDERGTGAGLAAGIGKSGAVAGAFIIPQLLHWGGATLVLGVSIAVMIAGALVTIFAAPHSTSNVVK